MRPVEEKPDVEYVDNDEEITREFIEEPTYNPFDDNGGETRMKPTIMRETRSVVLKIVPSRI